MKINMLKNLLHHLVFFLTIKKTPQQIDKNMCKRLLPLGFEPRVSHLKDRHANQYTKAAYTTQHYTTLYTSTGPVLSLSLYRHNFSFVISTWNSPACRSTPHVYGSYEITGYYKYWFKQSRELSGYFESLVGCCSAWAYLSTHQAENTGDSVFLNFGKS